MIKNNLKQLRKSAGLTQAELSRLSGISLDMVKSLEINRADISKSAFSTVIMLCISLRCSVSDLFSLEELVSEHNQGLFNNSGDLIKKVFR